MKDIKVIQAAFNLSDPAQKKLYDYIKNQTTNQSSYLKRMIYREMEGLNTIQHPTEEKIDPNEETFMRDLLK